MWNLRMRCSVASAIRLRRPRKALVDALVAAAQYLRKPLLVGHQRLLDGEAIRTGELCLQRVDLGLAPRCVRMVDVIPRAVAAPAGRQLHALYVDRLVGERGQRVGLAGPGRESALQPLRIVAARKILTEVRAAALGANLRAVSDGDR